MSRAEIVGEETEGTPGSSRRTDRAQSTTRQAGKDDPMERRPTSREREGREAGREGRGAGPAGGPAPLPAVRRALGPALRAGAAAVAAFVLAAAFLAPAPATAQETEEDLAGPAMADAPNQFAASAVGGWMGWDDPGTADGQEVEGGSLLGVELETRVSRYVHFRLGAAYGRASITGPDPEGASRTVDANQIVLELAATPRLSVGPLRRSGVVPFGVLGAGSVVHDPRTEPGQFDPALPTRSQGSLVYGAGVEVAPPALGDIGIRAEWRRAQVQLQNPFEPTSLEGTARGSSRFMGSVHWSF